MTQTAHQVCAQFLRRPLVICRDPLAVSALRECLASLGAPDLLVAGSPAEALEIFKTAAPSLIFVDSHSNGLNGPQIIRDFRRSDSPCRAAPMILLVKAVNPALVNSARDAGVNELLARPFLRHDVMRRLLTLAKQERPWVEAAAYVGPCRRRSEAGTMPPGTDRRRNTIRRPVVFLDS